jgi:hypothetical protein
MDDFVPKPIRIEALRQVLERWAPERALESRGRTSGSAPVR